MLFWQGETGKDFEDGIEVYVDDCYVPYPVRADVENGVVDAIEMDGDGFPRFGEGGNPVLVRFEGWVEVRSVLREERDEPGHNQPKGHTELCVRCGRYRSARVRTGRGS